MKFTKIIDLIRNYENKFYRARPECRTKYDVSKDENNYVHGSTSSSRTVDIFALQITTTNGFLKKNISGFIKSLFLILNLITTIAYSSVVERKNFFVDIMGISESEFVKFYDNKSKAQIANFLQMQKINDKNIYFLRNQKTGELFQAGGFSQYSIKELRDQTKNLPKIGGGKFNVVEARDTQKAYYRKFVDVGALQADKTNNDALFVVASNKSCLEPIDIYDYPEKGIEKSIYDYTQGPFAAISAAAGFIFRSYYIFCKKHFEATKWRQTKNHQINLLDETDIPVENGYIVFNDQYLNKPIDANLVEKIKIGYHHDVQVTFGFLNDLKMHTRIYDQAQIINQIFTAGVDFGNTNYEFVNNENAKKIAQIILDGAYEGIIRTAILHGKKNVFLTLIGGGVFNNKIISIARAIEKNIGLIQDYGLNVTLIIYDGNSANIKNQMPEFRKLMESFVNMSNGLYTIYQ